MKVYFTYGTSENQPFIGGWTEVEAPDIKTACALFRAYHPDKTEGILNCADYYTEEQFKDTTMHEEGNYGYRCRERISLTHKLLKEDSRKGIVITPGGFAFLKDFEKPLHESLGAAVGGWFEIVHPKNLEAPYCMMVNEEGLLKRLPLNNIASCLYNTQIHGQPIVGAAVIMKDGYVDGEPDIVGLDDDDIKAIAAKLAKYNTKLMDDEAAYIACLGLGKGETK